MFGSHAGTGGHQLAGNQGQHSHLMYPLPDHSARTLREHLENDHHIPVKPDHSLSDLVNIHWRAPHLDAHRWLQIEHSKDYAFEAMVADRLADFKGDKPGHEFHGNQWTGGMGGNPAEKYGWSANKAVPIRTGNVYEALAALEDQRKVILNQPREVATLLSKLHQAARRAKDERIKKINLCNVSVPGTNIFCADHKGIIRDDMPQLTGKPLPGSPADKLPKDKDGGVNLVPGFIKLLAEMGIKSTVTTELASHLRATQSELQAAKVASIMNRMVETGKPLPGPPIMATNDGYIADGHHRWAAMVGMDVRSATDTDFPLPIVRVNLPILDLLPIANAYAEQQGIPQAKM